MSRQISFFHSEHDSIRFVQEIDKNKGMILIGDSAVPPTFVESMILSKMCTYSCKFSIIPSKLFLIRQQLNSTIVVRETVCREHMK